MVLSSTTRRVQAAREDYPVIGLIVAATHDGIIGVDGKIPWHYPGDMRRFAWVTADSTVIMGRRTWESLPKKDDPLPGRRMVVVTSNHDIGNPKAETFKSLDEALKSSEGDVWFIGGEMIYSEALRRGVVDLVDVTRVPDYIVPGPGSRVARFDIEPFGDLYHAPVEVKHPEQGLRTVRYIRADYYANEAIQERMSCMEQLIASMRRDMKRAAGYKGVEAWPCPLCTYALGGKFVAYCEMHRQIHELHSRIQELESGCKEDRQDSSKD